VTPSFFVAISFNFTADLYIYFPTSNKMAIIGTLLFRFSDKKTTTLQRLPDTNMCIKIIYISIQGKLIGNIQNYEALEGLYWTT
jgi:hypothetical protein